MQNSYVKSASEIAVMKRAAAITDDVFDCVLAALDEGVSEKEIAALIEKEFSARGAEGTSFDTIVAFGAGGAEPHHVPADTRLERGMFVTVDMGCVVEGLCSDFTRTVAFGEPDAEMKAVYDSVYRARKAGVASVGGGVPCKDVDAAARGILSEDGYAEYFVHGTGHGVGSLIHEPPTLNATSEDVLRCGQVVTVEPGVYFPGKFGVRIEDMVAVGENRPFSRHSTELIVIG